MTAAARAGEFAGVGPIAGARPAATRDYADAGLGRGQLDDEFAVLLVDEDGLIRDCDDAAESWFDYASEDLYLRPISVLLPQLADVSIFRDGLLNARLRYFCRLGVCFAGVSRSGRRFACDLYFTDLRNANLPRLRLLVRRSADTTLGGFAG